MNIIEAIRESLVRNNYKYPISIVHRHMKDKWGLFTIYVIFENMNSIPKWMRVEEDYGLVLPGGDIYAPNIVDYLNLTWEPSNEIPQIIYAKGGGFRR